MDVVIGTAGWGVPASESGHFPAVGTALERYAQVFGGLEINSSFHRSHRPATWERWAASVPEHFRFAVKAPKTITHKQKLIDCAAPLRAFLAEMEPLGDKLEVVLVQLPPSLAFERGVAQGFFEDLRGGCSAAIACEPRHPSWFDDAAEALLERLQVARVAADPARVPAAALPGGWRAMSYFRLHGSPVPYRSSYDEERLDGYARLIRTDAAAGRRCWCIFDNTASSAAAGNALSLMAKVQEMAEVSH